MGSIQVEAGDEIDVATLAVATTFYRTPEPVINATIANISSTSYVIEWEHENGGLRFLNYTVNFESATLI